MRRRTPFLLSFVLLGAAASAAQEPAQPTPRELFLKNCAQCHGENGDGNGVQKLDKPARSFKDGGFSYGNTPEALLRTITYGIPGTPMPSFSSALTEAQRKQLAAYVLTLGPEVVEVKASDTRLVVKDAPLFVRGKLPPIVAGAPESVRGLLVGTPDGFTFEYAVDDVRLLGVRQGDFVERRDWGGRGGDALAPLGRLVLRAAPIAFEPACSWACADPEVEAFPLAARLLATRADGDRARVLYRLTAGAPLTSERLDARAGRPSVPPFTLDAEETVRGAARAQWSGFRRELALDGRALREEQGGTLHWTLTAAAPGPESVTLGANWLVAPTGDGRFVLAVLDGPKGARLGWVDHGVFVAVSVRRGGEARVGADVYVLAEWNDAVRRAWEQELAR